MAWLDAELFALIPIETIKERESEDIREDLLEPKIGRGIAMTDDVVNTNAGGVVAGKYAAYQIYNQ